MQPFRLGRNRPPAKRKMCLHDYRLPTVLPTPPDAISYALRATAPLSQMYLNDELGDCVIACMAHAVGVFTANAGGPPDVYTNTQVIAMYSAISGYDPNAKLVDGENPTDNGCDERTAMAYWQAQGAPAGSNKIAGWVSIDGSNITRVKTALWLFENLVFGVELPDKWIDPVPGKAGFLWDVAGPPDEDNGHCFLGVGYDQQGVIIDSWGILGKVTWQAVAKYATTSGSGELYAVLSPQVIVKAMAKAPNGFDWAALQADFAGF